MNIRQFLNDKKWFKVKTFVIEKRLGLKTANHSLLLYWFLVNITFMFVLRISFEMHRLLIIVFIAMLNGENIFRLWHVFKLSWAIVLKSLCKNGSRKTRNKWIILFFLLSQKLKLEGLSLILFSVVQALSQLMCA